MCAKVQNLKVAENMVGRGTCLELGRKPLEVKIQQQVEIEESISMGPSQQPGTAARAQITAIPSTVLLRQEHALLLHTSSPPRPQPTT